MTHRIAVDLLTILGFIVAAGYIYLLAYKFIKPKPKLNGS